jgi:hypothetical protein
MWVESNYPIEYVSLQIHLNICVIIDDLWLEGMMLCSANQKDHVYQLFNSLVGTKG